MDFYLSSADGRRLQFPLPPERISIQTDARLQSFAVIELGELALPRGQQPARISWEGRFPGAPRQGLPFVANWRSPQELIADLGAWRAFGARLRLLVTETPINLDVYIATFETSWGGGYGDCEYRLSLTEARAMRIYTDAEWRGGAAVATTAGQAAARPAPPPPRTYTVQPGDTLWAIAKRTLGDGSRWRELYQANQDVIGADPNKISPGQTLRVPGSPGSAA